jgi:RNA polymerase sigma factor (sigma-70 family)
MHVGDESYCSEDFLAVWAALHGRALGRAIILVGRNDAEDAVQETFVKLWATWKKSPAKREVIINRPGYTFTALRRTCIDLLEQKNRQQESVVAGEHVAYIPGGSNDDIVHSKVREALRSLNQTEWEIAYRTFYEKQPAAVIAGEMGLRVGTVYNYRSSIKRKLQSHLTSSDGEGAD